MPELQQECKNVEDIVLNVGKEDVPTVLED